MVECATDNKNRTVSEVRHAFSKHGGNLGTDGSVAYLFTRLGTILYGPEADEETVMEVAVGAGAEDIDSADDGIEVTTTPEALHTVVNALTEAGCVPEQSEIVQRPATDIELDTDDAEKLMRLVDALEELDDVQDVFTNASFPESMMAEA